MTNLESFKNLYVAEGGNAADVADLTNSADVVNALAGFKAISDTIVMAEKGTFNLADYGKTVSQLQSGVVVADGAITGTLKFISGGLSPAGPLAGDGNFMCLKFENTSDADSIKVGLVPSAGTGLVEIIGDPDMNAVAKVAGVLNGQQQVFKVVTKKGNIEKTQTYDLSGLVLETE